MFDKYGEFDSAEELNAAAAGQKAEGDTGALKELAEENGIDEDDVQDYMDGVTDSLCTPLTAAYGKLTVETAVLRPVEIVEDWVSYIRVQCMDNPDMAAAVRRKDRHLKDCMAKILTWSFKNSYAVDSDIVKAAGVRASSVKMGIPDMATAKRLIREYYLGGDENEKEVNTRS